MYCLIQWSLMNCSSIGCDLGRGMDIHIFFLVLSQSLPPHSLNSVPRRLQRKSISFPKGKPFKYLKTVILASLKSPLMQVKYLQFLPSFLFLFFFLFITISVTFLSKCSCLQMGQERLQDCPVGTEHVEHLPWNEPGAPRTTAKAPLSCVHLPVVLGHMHCGTAHTLRLCPHELLWTTLSPYARIVQAP